MSAFNEVYSGAVAQVSTFQVLEETEVQFEVSLAAKQYVSAHC